MRQALFQQVPITTGPLKNIYEVTVDFGEGALGIQPENYRKAVKSVKIMKDNELVLDAQGGYWFPSTGYGKPEESA